MKLHIESMMCGGCARGVTASIQQVDPTAKLDIDLNTKMVVVESTVSAESLIAALAENGFAAQVQVF